MIFSKNLLFSDNQDLAKTVGTYVSTNTIDTGEPGTSYGHAAPLVLDAGPGTPIPVLVQITESFTSGSVSRLLFQIETATDSAFTSNAEVIASSQIYTLGELIAGKQFEVAWMPNKARRFLRVNYVISGVPTTAGKCTSGIVLAVQTN